MMRRRKAELWTRKYTSKEYTSPEGVEVKDTEMGRRGDALQETGEMGRRKTDLLTTEYSEGGTKRSE